MSACEAMPQPAARAKIADEIFQHFFPVKKR